MRDAPPQPLEPAAAPTCSREGSGPTDREELAAARRRRATHAAGFVARLADAAVALVDFGQRASRDARRVSIAARALEPIDQRKFRGRGCTARRPRRAQRPPTGASARPAPPRQTCEQRRLRRAARRRRRRRHAAVTRKTRRRGSPRRDAAAGRDTGEKDAPPAIGSSGVDVRASLGASRRIAASTLRGSARRSLRGGACAHRPRDGDAACCDARLTEARGEARPICACTAAERLRGADHGARRAPAPRAASPSHLPDHCDTSLRAAHCAEPHEQARRRRRDRT